MDAKNKDLFVMLLNSCQACGQQILIGIFKIDRQLRAINSCRSPLQEPHLHATTVSQPTLASTTAYAVRLYSLRYLFGPSCPRLSAGPPSPCPLIWVLDLYCVQCDAIPVVTSDGWGKASRNVLWSHGNGRKEEHAPYHCDIQHDNPFPIDDISTGSENLIFPSI